MAGIGGSARNDGTAFASGSVQWLRRPAALGRESDERGGTSGECPLHEKQPPQYELGSLWLSTSGLVIVQADAVITRVGVTRRCPLRAPACACSAASDGLARGHELDAAAVAAHCRKDLASCKRSRYVLLVEGLPRSTTDKVNRNALHAWCADLGQSPSA
jgi:hypothetical protein